MKEFLCITIGIYVGIVLADRFFKWAVEKVNRKKPTGVENE